MARHKRKRISSTSRPPYWDRLQQTTIPQQETTIPPPRRSPLISSERKNNNSTVGTEGCDGQPFNNDADIDNSNNSTVANEGDEGQKEINSDDVADDTSKNSEDSDYSDSGDNAKPDDKSRFDDPEYRRKHRLNRKQDSRVETVINMKDGCVRRKVEMIAKHTKTLQFCSTFANEAQHLDCPGYIHFLACYDNVMPKPHTKPKVDNNWDYRRKGGPILTFLVGPGFDAYRKSIGNQLIKAGRWFINNHCENKGPYHTQSVDEYLEQQFGRPKLSPKCQEAKDLIREAVALFADLTEEEGLILIDAETSGMTEDEIILFCLTLKGEIEKQFDEASETGSLPQGLAHCFSLSHKAVAQKRKKTKKKKKKKRSKSSIPPHMMKPPPPGPRKK